MDEERPTRRTMLKLAGTAAVGVLGFGERTAAEEKPATYDGPITDVHFHLVNARLPGLPAQPAPDETVPLAPFDKASNPDGAAKLARAIEAKLAEANVEAALCMPRQELSDADPLGIKEIEAMAALVRGSRLYPIGFAHPERFDRDHMTRVESVLVAGRVKALKAYLGYLAYGPEHPGYRPYYALAAKYKVPVILHTGDPYSSKAKVKFAHPLRVDEIAVDYPDTRFVLAHFGNPWLMDAAEVVYKNDNVWADLSGLVVGTKDVFTKAEKDGSLGRVVKRLREAIEFSEAPDRFLFGSDWPLAPVVVYRDFVRRMVPKEHQRAVFRENARELFGV